MAQHGSVGEFQSAQEDWLAYVDRLQQYFTANDVDKEEKQRAILLSSVGAFMYRLIRNLLAPDKPTDHTIAGTVDAVQANPPPQTVCDRTAFPFSLPFTTRRRFSIGICCRAVQTFRIL